MCPSMIAHPSAPRVTTETGKIPRSSRSTCTARSSRRRRHLRLEVRGVGVEPGDHSREVAVLALERVDLVDEVACDAEARGRCRPPRGGRAVRGPRRGRTRRDMAAAGFPALRACRTRCAWSTRAVCSSISSAIGWHLPASAVLAHLSPPGPSPDAAGGCRAGVVAAAVDDVGPGQVAQRRAEHVHQPGEGPQREEAEGDQCVQLEAQRRVGHQRRRRAGRRGTSGTRPRRPRGSRSRRRGRGSSRRWCSTCRARSPLPGTAYMTLSIAVVAEKTGPTVRRR